MEDLLRGIIRFKDKIAPSFIDNTNPKYLVIDKKYYSGIIVVDYYREYDEIIFKNLINSNMNMKISIFYEKQDIYKTIKGLTYFIGNNALEISSKNQNRQDIDLVAFSYNDAKYIRKEIQVNNEDLYFLYTYIELYCNSVKELEHNLNSIEAILSSCGIITRRAYFRQNQIYQSTSPYMINNGDLKEAARRNVLTSGLLATYPFISSSVCDKNGIFIGTNMYNHSIILMDRFDKEKYKNANMCIFGKSGAGKSFYTKLTILRNYCFNVEQYVIDPEREYAKVSDYLDGLTIKIGPTSETFINILDIRQESIEEGTGYLATKLSKLRGFFSLIIENVDEEKLAILEEKMIEVYKDYGITFDDNSLYDKKGEKYIFKTSEEMPILEDLYKKIKENKYKDLKNKLYPFCKGSLNFLNKRTNIELNNKLIIADIYDLGEENLKYGMYIFTMLFWDKIKNDRNIKKSIYLDEIWRLIGVTSNRFVASFIYKIFKTIRKYGGSSVAITQDISDLFSLEEGIYGKAILNNSSIKTFFSLEEENINVLSKYANISEKEKIEIKSLKRGESLMFIGEDHLLVKIESTKTEREIVE